MSKIDWRKEIRALFNNKYTTGEIDFQIAVVATAMFVLGMNLWEYWL